jgi:DNA-binding transcriptional regulator YbjK
LSERPVRGEARRELILDAAIRVLGDEGLGALTHRRVAAEAGLPLAATTYWFASKEDLLQHAYRRAAERDIARVRRMAATAVDEGLDLADAMATVLTAELEEGRTALIACFTMWLEAARRPELRPIEAEWTEAYVSVIEGLLADAGSPQPRLDAEIVTAALDGLLLALLARDAGAADLRAQLRPQLRRLVQALTAG